MAKITLKKMTGNFNSSATQAFNVDEIEDEFNNRVFYRDNPIGESNELLNDIDINANDILNANNIGLTGRATSTLPPSAAIGEQVLPTLAQVRIIFGLGATTVTVGDHFPTLTLALATASVLGLYLRTDTYGAGIEAGGNTYKVVAGGTGTPDGGSFINMTDGSGFQLQGIFPDGVYASQFGVTTGLAIDDLTKMQAAVDYVAGGILELPIGTITTSGEINLSVEGTQIHGQGGGSFFDGIGAKSAIECTATTGAVIRLSIENCHLSNFEINASAARTAAARDNTAANYNGGIRVEGLDVVAPEGDVFDTIIERMHIINQPNDGIVIVGRCYGTVLRKIQSTGNGGHGIVVSNGLHTARTNVAIAGLVSFYDIRYFNNEGHGIKCGADDANDRTFRVHTVNCEGFQNGGTPAILEDVAESFYHCDGYTNINGAASGVDKSGTPSALAGYALMGLGGSLIEPRILETTVPIRILKHASRETEGWNIQGPHIRTTLATHIVFADAGISNLKVWVGDSTGLIANATSRTDIPGLDTFNDNIRITDETRTIQSQTTFEENVLDSNGLNMRSIAVITGITTTPATILNASLVGRMWKISGRHTGDPCLSSFTCEVVGGATPVVTNVVNQTGAAVSYLITVSGTDIQAAVSAGSRASGIFIMQTVI